MLTKLRPIVGEEVSLALYKSLMVPLLDYADMVYDTLSAQATPYYNACKIAH